VLRRGGSRLDHALLTYLLHQGQRSPELACARFECVRVFAQIAKSDPGRFCQRCFEVYDKIKNRFSELYQIMSPELVCLVFPRDEAMGHLSVSQNEKRLHQVVFPLCCVRFDFLQIQVSFWI